MGIVTVIILAFGLCFDSFAVSLSHGVSKGCRTRGELFAFAGILAVFQGAMPLVGWFLASGINSYVAIFDHWIAFALLLLLGVKMIWESFHPGKEEKSSGFQFKRACILGLATSIDALFVGVVLAMVELHLLAGMSQSANMLVAVGVIGMVTFISSLTGLFIGNKASGKLADKAELVGGIVLILLGIKVLFEHIG